MLTRTKGVIETQLDFPPFKSGSSVMWVRPTVAATNAFIWGPPYIASGYVTWTGPVVPWNDAFDAAPLARCWSLGAENDSAWSSNTRQ